MKSRKNSAKGKSQPSLTSTVSVSGPLGSRQFSEALPPVIQLRPYQQRWIDDKARFKIAVKSARTGFSFGTGIESLLDCIENADGGTTWTVLSASKAQSVEFVELAQKNLQAIGATGQLYNEPYEDIEGVSSITQSRIQILNSRIIALPANPRTARGYPGNAILDEHAHQADSYAIWAAVARQVALGHKLRSVSTPNSEQGKFFDLASDLGVADGVAPKLNPFVKGNWSCHWVDVYLAVKEGCPINVEEMRDLFKDEESFSQEFLCVFIKAVGSWLGIDLVAMAEDSGATVDWPAGYVPQGPLYGGIDVARDRDKTVLWLDEYIGDVAWTRMVMRLHAKSFPDQHEAMLPWVKMANRTAVDCTGMGVGIFDYLDKACRGRVMGINFAGKNDQGVRIKTDMAIRMKERFEKHLDRIPKDADIRQAMLAIKRESTATGVKFDAPRIEIDSPSAGGKKKKMWGHADEFWAKAMASLARGGAHDVFMESFDPEERAGRRRDPRGVMSQQFGQMASRETGEEEYGEPVGTGRNRRSVWGN